MPVPANVSNPGFDVLGNPLDYRGRVARSATLKTSPSGTFNGTTEFVSVADSSSLNITDHMSVHCSFENSAAGLASEEVIAAKFDSGADQREWSIGIGDDEKIFARFGDSSDGTLEGQWTSDSAIATNVPGSVGMTFDGGTVVLYHNGSAVAGSLTSGAVPSAMHNGSSAITLGASLVSGSGVNHWAGKLHDFQLWASTSTTVLTASQMLSLHNRQPVASLNQSRVIWLPFSDYSGSAVGDVSGNGNGGVWQTATPTTAGAGVWAQQQDVFHYIASTDRVLSSPTTIDFRPVANSPDLRTFSIPGDGVSADLAIAGAKKSLCRRGKTATTENHFRLSINWPFWSTPII